MSYHRGGREGRGEGGYSRDGTRNRSRSRDQGRNRGWSRSRSPLPTHRAVEIQRSRSRSYRRSWGKSRDERQKPPTPRMDGSGYGNRNYGNGGGGQEYRQRRRSGERTFVRYYYKKGYKSRSIRRPYKYSSDYGTRSSSPNYAAQAAPIPLSRRRSGSRSRDRRGGRGGYDDRDHGYVPRGNGGGGYPQYPRSRGGGGGGERRKSWSKVDSKAWSGESEEEEREDSGSSSKDDTVGHYEGKKGDTIGEYTMVQEVGVGTFGRVLECTDRRNGRHVAIKMVRSIKKYTESAKIEAEILEDVRKHQEKRRLSLIVELFGDFEFQGHYCLVFERLGMSLYDYLKAHDFSPYPLGHVRDFARQLLESLAFLRSINLIHTDLKPENILLCSDEMIKVGGSDVEVPASTAVKVIDFGGATYDDDDHKSTIVNTRQYRAPEVILEVGWSFPSDLWSAGCIIAELYTGDLFFATHDNMEHLALMERSLGPFPANMLQKSKVSSTYFDREGRSRWRQALDRDGQRHVRRMKRVKEVFERDIDSGISEVVQGLLTIDPQERMTAEAALRMPFFNSGPSGRRDL